LNYRLLTKQSVRQFGGSSHGAVEGMLTVSLGAFNGSIE